MDSIPLCSIAVAALAFGLAACEPANDETPPDASAAEQAPAAEVDSEQSQQLTRQFASGAEAVQSQFQSLSAMYTSAKDGLPADTVQAIERNLPKLERSVESLTSMVETFSPESMRQIEEFQTRYSKQLEVAQQLVDEIMQILANR